MINMIFGHYVKSKIPGFYNAEFWVYYTNKPARHVEEYGLSRGECAFLCEAEKNNRVVKTFDGFIYLSPVKKSPDDSGSNEPEKRYIGGYHQYKYKGGKHGKKKAANVARRN